MILFASDLHLSPDEPEVARRFLAFLAGPGRRAAEIYLLGDIFEYWAGDDDLDDPFIARVVAALRECTRHGVEIGFLAGNRDFLIGDRFAAATGVRLLPDPCVLSVPTWQFVLTHGDQLCTDDLEYQDFRRKVRSSAWQRDFLGQPLAERKRVIADLRERSTRSKSEKVASAPYLMDVNAAATDDFLHDHGYATLIHGHTHQPSRHEHIVDGIVCERWVLSDWTSTPPHPRGDYLEWDGERLSRHAA